MRRDTKIAGAVFAALPLLIVGAAVADTWAIAHGASMKWRLLFRAICHGIPARCLTLWHVPMPLCARCTAIYAGIAIGLAAFAMLPSAREKVLRWILILAVIPLTIDGVSQGLRLRESTNDLRVATGLAAGFAFGMWVLSALERRDAQGVTTS
ncbi:MAG: DUF2085 domain-containing protein [Acidobacteriota bacterium]